MAKKNEKTAAQTPAPPPPAVAPPPKKATLPKKGSVSRSVKSRWQKANSGSVGHVSLKKWARSQIEGGSKDETVSTWLANKA